MSKCRCRWSILVWYVSLGGWAALGGETKEESVGQLPDVVVADQSESYRAESTTVATRTNAPLAEIPFAVQVVRRSVFQDQGALSLEEALENLSGVSHYHFGGFLGTSDNMSRRGFSSNYLYYNGFLMEALGNVNLQMVEQIEYLKGPASAMYGMGDPGGVINIRTKGPQASPAYTLQSRFGSWDYREVSVDATGPLNQDGTVLYRFLGGHLTTDSFRDYAEDDRCWLAPSLALQLSESTILRINYSFTKQQRTIDEGVSFDVNREPIADIETFLGDPDYPGQSFRHHLLDATLIHEMNEHLTLRSGMIYSHWNTNVEGVRRSKAEPNADSTVTRLFDWSDHKQRALQWYNDAVITVGTGPVSHRLLAGIDLRWRRNRMHIHRYSIDPVSITDPDYGIPLGALTRDSDSTAEQNWEGLYLQDEVELLGDRLFLTVAGRGDRVEVDNGSTRVIRRAITGRGGLLYRFPAGQVLGSRQRVGVFANVSESFAPSAIGRTDTDGNQLEPETGRQYEAGLKFELLDERAIATLAVYQDTRDDVSVSDPDSPGFYLPAGRITPSLEVIANYTYCDTEVLHSDALPEGARFHNVPLHCGNLWAKYTIPDGAMRNVGFGVGMHAESARMGDNAGNFLLDGYVTWQAALFYRTELRPGQVLDLQLNVKNILDEEYYQTSTATTRVYPGTPRSLEFSMAYHF
jgi:iron complex outermembrane receptor protein